MASEWPAIRRPALVGVRGRRILAVEAGDQIDPATLKQLEERLAWAQLDGIRIVWCIPTDARHNAKADYAAIRLLLQDSPN